MRGVIILFTMVIVAVALALVAPAAVEPVGEEIKDVGDLDQDQEDRIDNLYTAIFIRIPLVLMFGMGVFAVIWYIRRQATVRRR